LLGERQKHKLEWGSIVNAVRNVSAARKETCKESSARNPQKLIFGRQRLLWLGLGASALLFCAPSRAQSQQSPDVPATGIAGADQPAKPAAGTIGGSVVDGSGAVVTGAIVKLSSEEQSPGQDAVSDTDGRFFFAGVAPGPFQLTVTSAGFTTQGLSGTLHPGEDLLVPPIILAVATASTEVRVSLTPTEMAEAEIKDEEKQRVLGVIPNFYVTYNPAAVPLHPKQKFELAWRATIDPITVGLNAAFAGIEQATNAFSGYGQGAQGYGKRFGASYATSVTSTFIGSAILPSLFKQDPRYFYKATGSRRSRFFYAIANSVICKGDNGHWQANYSYLLGSLAAGGISNLYYPNQIAM